MADFRRIIASLLAGDSYTQITATCRCSRRDIATARKAIDTHRLTQESLAALSDVDIAGMFPDRRRNVSTSFDQPDFKDLLDRFKHSKHFTLLQGWRMYVATPSTAPRKYSYSQFCQNFADYVGRHDLTAVLHHIPGKAMHVDWAGDTLPVVDPVTGKSQPAHFFIAVLPYSGMIHVTAT